jgi:type I restriction enzyme M protein
VVRHGGRGIHVAPYHHAEAVGFIWAIADLLRGSYKAHDYGDVILPLVVLRRLDQALVDTKPAVLDRNWQGASRPGLR